MTACQAISPSPNRRSLAKAQNLKPHRKPETQILNPKPQTLNLEPKTGSGEGSGSTVYRVCSFRRFLGFTGFIGFIGFTGFVGFVGFRVPFLIPGS